jgi:hypothetical protein
VAMAMLAFIIQFVFEPNMFFAAAFGTNYSVLLALRLKMRNTDIFIGETLGKFENIHDDFILLNCFAMIYANT